MSNAEKALTIYSNIDVSTDDIVDKHLNSLRLGFDMSTDYLNQTYQDLVHISRKVCYALSVNDDFLIELTNLHKTIHPLSDVSESVKSMTNLVGKNLYKHINLVRDYKIGCAFPIRTKQFEEDFPTFFSRLKNLREYQQRKKGIKEINRDFRLLNDLECVLDNVFAREIVRGFNELGKLGFCKNMSYNSAKTRLSYLSENEIGFDDVDNIISCFVNKERSKLELLINDINSNHELINSGNFDTKLLNADHQSRIGNVHDILEGFSAYLGGELC
jgi:hypothetical protein